MTKRYLLGGSSSLCPGVGAAGVFTASTGERELAATAAAAWAREAQETGPPSSRNGRLPVSLDLLDDNSSTHRHDR